MTRYSEISQRRFVFTKGNGVPKARAAIGTQPQQLNANKR